RPTRPRQLPSAGRTTSIRIREHPHVIKLGTETLIVAAENDHSVTYFIIDGSRVGPNARWCTIGDELLPLRGARQAVRVGEHPDVVGGAANKPSGQISSEDNHAVSPWIVDRSVARSTAGQRAARRELSPNRWHPDSISVRQHPDVVQTATGAIVKGPSEHNHSTVSLIDDGAVASASRG